MNIQYDKGFKKSWDKLFAWYYAPLRWWKAFLAIPWEIKQLWQRATRGWADKDTWGLDNYLLTWLPDAIRYLRDSKVGHPAQLDSIEEWKKILDQMADGLESGKHINCWEAECERLQERNQWEFDRGMELFKKWFFALWD